MTGVLISLLTRNDDNGHRYFVLDLEGKPFLFHGSDVVAKFHRCSSSGQGSLLYLIC